MKLYFMRIVMNCKLHLVGLKSIKGFKTPKIQRAKPQSSIGSLCKAQTKNESLNFIKKIPGSIYIFFNIQKLNILLTQCIQQIYNVIDF